MEKKKLAMTRKWEDMEGECVFTLVMKLRDDYLMMPKRSWPNIKGFKRFVKARYPYFTNSNVWQWVEQVQFETF